MTVPREQLLKRMVSHPLPSVWLQSPTPRLNDQKVLGRFLFARFRVQVQSCGNALFGRVHTLGRWFDPDLPQTYGREMQGVVPLGNWSMLGASADALTTWPFVVG